PYLNHAVMGAYNELLPLENHPLYVLFIDIDPAKIDINVHPTKTEIKYQDDRSIYAIIRSAVKRSLGRYNITPTLDFDQETGFNNMISPLPLDDIVAPSVNFNPSFNPFDECKKKPTGTGGGFSKNTDNSSGLSNQNWEKLYEITDRAEVQLFHLHNVDEASVEVSSEILIFQTHNR